jgi:hypothetical protein
VTSKSYAPIIAGSGGVILKQLNELPGSGVAVVGVDATGQLSLIDTEDLPAGPAGADGQDGADGATGQTGPAGPNTVSTSTTTTLVGLLIGNGSAVNATTSPTLSSLTVSGDVCVDKTRTSSTNFESFVIDPLTLSTAFRVGPKVGSAGGTERVVQYGRYNSSGVWITGIQIDANGFVGDMAFGAGSQLSFSGNGVFRWIASAVLRLTNSAVAAGVCLSMATDALLTIRNRTNTADAALQCSGLRLTSLPTSDPAVAGQLWNDGGTVKVSAG